MDEESTFYIIIVIASLSGIFCVCDIVFIIRDYRKQNKFTKRAKIASLCFILAAVLLAACIVYLTNYREPDSEEVEGDDNPFIHPPPTVGVQLPIDVLGDETSYFPNISARELHADLTDFLEKCKEFFLTTDKEILKPISDDPENPFFPTGYERRNALRRDGWDCFIDRHPETWQKMMRFWDNEGFANLIKKVYLENDFPELGGSHIELFTPEDFLILTEPDGDYATWGLPENAWTMIRNKADQAHNIDTAEQQCKYYLNHPGLRGDDTYTGACSKEEARLPGYYYMSRFCMVYDEDEETINVEETQDSLCSKYQENPDMFTKVITKIEQCNDDEYSEDISCFSDKVLEIEWTPDLCSVETEENPP